MPARNGAVTAWTADVTLWYSTRRGQSYTLHSQENQIRAMLPVLSVLALAALAPIASTMAFTVPDFPVNVTVLQEAAGNLTCDQGKVAYGYVRAATGIPLSTAMTYFSNWTSNDVVPGALVNASGTDTGATRSYTFRNTTFNQELVSTNMTEDGITLQWNLTAPVMLSSMDPMLKMGNNLTIYKNVEDVTFYQNGTTGTNYLQYWNVGCFSNETLGSTFSALGTSIYLNVFVQALSQQL